MKTILVAGGAGFIGSNLCDKLLNDNHKIICLDNLLTGNIKNIEHLISNSNFKFINHDIIYPLEINEDINEIYNFACPASPPKYQIDPINTLKVNFFGVLNLLEFARFKKAKFLQSSTSEVYGEPEITPQHENYRGNVDTRIVRIFNTYGPKMDKNDGRVVSNFINQALENRNITIYGNGDQTRSFCYIDDQINGLIRLMNSDYVYPINIGDPYEINMKELATIILELTGSDSKIEYKDLPMDDPTNRKPDITKAKNILNWEPTYNLKKGIIKTIEYFRNF